MTLKEDHFKRSWLVSGNGRVTWIEWQKRLLSEHCSFVLWPELIHLFWWQAALISPTPLSLCVLVPRFTFSPCLFFTFSHLLSSPSTWSTWSSRPTTSLPPLLLFVLLNFLSRLSGDWEEKYFPCQGLLSLARENPGCQSWRTFLLTERKTRNEIRWNWMAKPGRGIEPEL